MTSPDAFRPVTVGARTVFLDSSFLFALFHSRDENHENARSFGEYVRNRELSYRRLVTNDYVLDEVATRLRHRVSYEHAINALSSVAQSDVYAVEFVDPDVFDDGYKRFVDYHDLSLSFTDCVVAAHADELAVNHVVTYDDDFDALDCTVIPHYVA